MFLLFILSSLIINIGCQQENSAPPPNTSYESVTFETKDQVTLSGRVFGPVEGNPVILLTHSSTENQDSWNHFVDLLSEQGHTVMTFNFRGTSPSDGQKNENQFDIDINGALSWLQSRGVRGLVIIGSGEGASAAIKFTSTQRVIGVIALSPHLNLGGCPPLLRPFSFPGSPESVPGHLCSRRRSPEVRRRFPGEVLGRQRPQPEPVPLVCGIRCRGSFPVSSGPGSP